MTRPWLKIYAIGTDNLKKQFTAICAILIALNNVTRCVTMSLMKTISLRELHESTGAWVREAVRIGALVITDRGKPVARLEAVTANLQINPFLTRKLRPGYSKLRGKLSGGAESTQIVSEDRDSR